MPAPRPSLSLLALEDRTVLTTVSDGGTRMLTITLDSGDDLRVTSQGSSYRFLSINSNFTAGGLAAGNFGGLNTQTLTLTNLAAYDAVSIVDSAGAQGATVSFNGSGSNGYAKSFSVVLDEASVGPVKFDGASDFTGGAALSVATSRNVVLVNASVSSAAGRITLLANTQTRPTGGRFVGIEVNNSTVQSSGGSVTLRGRGGDSGGDQYGVLVFNGGAVVGGPAGDNLVEGTSGAGTGNANHGVVLRDAGARVTSAGGNVAVVGRSTATGTASGLNVGVYVDNGASVSAGGGGSVTVEGRGGLSGGEFNHGVAVERAGSVITSSGGPVTVFGVAGGAGGSDANFGVSVQNGGLVTAGGTGDVRVEGTGSALANGNPGDNLGVWVSGNGTSTGTVTSAGGNVTVVGRGGNATSTQSFGNIGVYVYSGGLVTAGGGGSVTVNGTGGTGPGKENVGVRIDGEKGGDTRVTSSGGPVSVVGIGGTGQERFNVGVHLVNSATLTAGGAGAVTVDGTGGTSVGDNQGVTVELGSRITSGGGPVAVTGRAAAGSGQDFQFGVRVQENGEISSGGVGPVTVTGVGAAAPSGTNGGVTVLSGSRITGAGPVTVTGTGAQGGSGSQFGVYLFGAGSTVSATGGGSVTVTGTGGTGSGGSNVGVLVVNGATIAGPEVSVAGTGGAAAADFNDGVRVAQAGSLIQASGPALRVTGQAGGTGGSSNNFGLSVNTQGVVRGPGQGASTTVSGRASPASGSNPHAVLAIDQGSLITTAGGNLAVVGNPGSGGGPNDGVAERTGGRIVAGAPGGTTIDGTGGSVPTASLTSAPAVGDGQAGDTTYDFTVTYAGGTAIDAGTLDANDVRVSGPGGFTVTAAFQGVSPAGNGTPRAATYRFTPPGGAWGSEDNGVYTLALQAGQVFDTLGTAAAGGQLGTINVSVAGSVPPVPPVTPPTPGAAVLVGSRQFAAGSDAGAGGTALLYNPDGSVRFSAAPFGGFAGGVRTAAADFNGDGVADLVAGTGPGRATQVVVLDGQTQAVLFDLAPFEAAFTGGVYVAAGDLDGDGLADLVVTPDEGGGPRARVFRGGSFAQMADFFGIADPNFRGGARPAVADITGDGRADLVVAAGFGGGPRVAVFSGAAIAAEGGQSDQGTARWESWKPFGDFLAFEPALRNGAFVAAGDVDGDGRADVVAGGGPGGGPRVTAFSGSELAAGRQTPTANFFAGDTASRGGIRVAVKNLDGDGRGDIVAGAGAGAGSRLTAYAGSALTPTGTPAELFAFDAIPGSAAGVFVG